MLLSIGLILLGLVTLVVGGELLVRGAASIASLARVDPMVIGLTVVAAGTSAPELVVSVRASLVGSPGISMGNVVGSNIFNIAVVLGIAALIAPLRIRGRTVRLEWPVMFLASFQLHLLVRDGALDRLEGGFFFIALVVFLVYIVRVARVEASADEEREFADEAVPPLGGAGRRAWLLSALVVVGGVLALIGGASALVRGSIEVARGLGLSETIIGLTIVAVGTSLPELATSAVAGRRGHDDIAVANLIGSNIFNVLSILSITALIRPLAVDPMIIARDNWWMLGFSLLLLPIMYTGRRISRGEGLVLLLAYGAYTAVLISQSR